jgi:hypothetical protein
MWCSAIKFVPATQFSFELYCCAMALSIVSAIGKEHHEKILLPLHATGVELNLAIEWD